MVDFLRLLMNVLRPREYLPTNQRGIVLLLVGTSVQISGWELPDSVNNGLSSEDLEVLFTEPGAYTISLFASNRLFPLIPGIRLLLLRVRRLPSFDPIPDFCEEATINFQRGKYKL